MPQARTLKSSCLSASSSVGVSVHRSVGVLVRLSEVRNNTFGLESGISVAEWRKGETLKALAE